MCYGYIDPKYGLRDLDRQVILARQESAETPTQAKPASGLPGWVGAVIRACMQRAITPS
jgi:hypothetical protein